MSETASQPTPVAKPPLKSFHFSCGDSAEGPIGFCGRVKAASREEALSVLREALPEAVVVTENEGAIQYLQVYFNPDKVKISDSDSGMDEQAT